MVSVDNSFLLDFSFFMYVIIRIEVSKIRKLLQTKKNIKGSKGRRMDVTS